MRILILAVLGLMVVGGGGAGAYFYFSSHKAEAAVGETAEHQEAAEAKPEGGGHGGGGHGKGGAPAMAFVQLDPLILPIIDENGVTQIVSIVVAIEVGDEAQRQIVKQMAPRLNDAYIQDMYGILNKRSALQDGVVQVGMIRDRLNAITRKILGEGVVKDVLLQAVQQRPV